MGDIKTGDKTEQGLFGYNNGERSIFLDAETGNATFGKSGAAQIKITASSGEGTIQSGDYNYSTTGYDGTGLKIKFSSTGTGTQQGPYIRYGSNKFSVSADGSIHAAGSGDIAGWNITDSTLYKSNVGINSNTENSSYDPNQYPNDISLNTNNGKMAFWAGSGSGNEAKNFYVTHSGYLFSKSGKIASWDITQKKLMTGSGDSSVGMGIDRGQDTTFNYNETSTTISSTAARFWSGTSFIVTNAGKLYSNSAQIGPWTVNDKVFENGNVGLGIRNFGDTNPFTSGTIAARFWAASGSVDSNLNFAVDNTGNLYSKAGKIGGWNIQLNRLYSSSGDYGINISSNGSISSKNWNSDEKTGYSINWNGQANFYNINANRGTIGGCIITDNGIKNASKNDTWSIQNSGLATFANIRVTNGSIVLGHTTITGSAVSDTPSFQSGGFSTSGSGNLVSSKLDNGVAVSKGISGIAGDTIDDYTKGMIHKYIAAQIAKLQWVAAKSISIAADFNVNSETGEVTKGDEKVQLGPGGINLLKGTKLNISDSKDAITVGGSTGRSGKITFSDNSSLTIRNGIIIGIQPAAGGDVGFNSD